MLPNIIDTIERTLTLEAVLAHYHIGKSNQQTEPDCTRYFCPLPRCRGDRRPHFVIDERVAVDAYDRPIDFDHHINQDVVVRRRWRCEQSRTEGYGTVSLVAAILGITGPRERWSRADMVSVIAQCAAIQGLPTKEIDPTAVNGWLKVYAPQEQWRISLSDTFSPEALITLALTGMEGIETRRIIDTLHTTFGLWQVERYTTAGCYPNGDHSSPDLYKSYERRAHAIFPIFAFCYDFETGAPIAHNPEKDQTKWVARIVMPAFRRERGEDFDWRKDFYVVLNSTDQRTDLRSWLLRRNIFADLTSEQVLSVKRNAYSDTHHASSSNPLSPSHQGHSVAAIHHQSSPHPDPQPSLHTPAQIALSIGEHITLTKEIETPDPDSKKPKLIIQTVDLIPSEQSLGKLVLCRTPLDAVSIYLWLNYPREYFTRDGKCHSSYYENSYWHVAWLKEPSMVLNPFEQSDLRLIAEDVFMLFGNDRAEISAANTNSLRFNYLRLCMLPTSMSELDPVDGGFGKPHVPHTPRDYFRYYDLTDDELTRNMLAIGSTTGSKALMLQKELIGSSAVRPFIKMEKSKRRPGEKNYTYDVDLNAAWKMMINAGYCRSIKRGGKRSDSIGQCYRIDGHFVYELTPESVLADMRAKLEAFAKDNSFGDPEEASLMMNAVLKCKALQDTRPIAVTRLPIMAMPKSESYGPELDHFFFRNGALEVTPTSIKFRRYEDLDFLVYRSQVLPYDYTQPFFDNRSPLSISVNPKWKQLKDEYETARRSSQYDADHLASLKRQLDEEGSIHQWQINILPTEELDNRMVIPQAIRNDEAHNQWLRWWPFLRLLRCFANEDWAQEEAGKYSDIDRDMVMARMANLMFTIGRCVYRYHGAAQYMPYFLEETTNKEGKAQGGSGKSMLINSFMRVARNVLTVDAKKLTAKPDMEKLFANFQLHYHDIVHIEDFPKMQIDDLFNYASGGFNFRVMYEDTSVVEREEAPMIAITSNFVVQSSDESAMGRVQLGTFSHYFSRDIPVLGKTGRSLDMVVPGVRFTESPEEYEPTFRNQVIYTLAKCCQFCMVATAMNLRVTSPGSGIREQIIIRDVTRTFYDWFSDFLSRDYIYNVPISINELFSSYKRYREASKEYEGKIARAWFYERMQIYCNHPSTGVLFMPIAPFLSKSEQNRSGSDRMSRSGEAKSYLRKGVSWITRNFVDDEGHLHSARILSSNAGNNCATGGAVWFSRVGEEPKSEEEMRTLMDKFAIAPDPEPIRDENDQPIGSAQYSQWRLLNTDEEAKTIRESGGYRPARQSSSPTPSSTVSPYACTPVSFDLVEGSSLTAITATVPEASPSGIPYTPGEVTPTDDPPF